MRRSIQTVEEFYAHALVIEREAAERYGEFALYFVDHGEDALAATCRKLASLERAHYHQLVNACVGIPLPGIEEGAYHWLSKESPEAPVRALFYRVAKPRQLLEIALGAELKARAFFVRVARTSSSPAVRELASIMAAEEVEHIGWVREALQSQAAPGANWEKLLERGVTPAIILGAERRSGAPRKSGETAEPATERRHPVHY